MMAGCLPYVVGKQPSVLLISWKKVDVEMLIVIMMIPVSTPFGCFQSFLLNNRSIDADSGPNFYMIPGITDNGQPAIALPSA